MVQPRQTKTTWLGFDQFDGTCSTSHCLTCAHRRPELNYMPPFSPQWTLTAINKKLVREIDVSTDRWWWGWVMPFGWYWPCSQLHCVRSRWAPQRSSVPPSTNKVKPEVYRKSHLADWLWTPPFRYQEHKRRWEQLNLTQSTDQLVWVAFGHTEPLTKNLSPRSLPILTSLKLLHRPGLGSDCINQQIPSPKP